jgi:hypothetical protein
MISCRLYECRSSRAFFLRHYRWEVLSFALVMSRFVRAISTFLSYNCNVFSSRRRQYNQHTNKVWALDPKLVNSYQISRFKVSYVFISSFLSNCRCWHCHVGYTFEVPQYLGLSLLYLKFEGYIFRVLYFGILHMNLMVGHGCPK